MSGKKNKKLRKIAKNQTKMTPRLEPQEDHSVPDDVAARLLGAMPEEMQRRTIFYPNHMNPGAKPISAALLDVADPWIREAADWDMDERKYRDFLQVLCSLAVLAWNLKSIENEAERQNAADDILDSLNTRPGEDKVMLALSAELLILMTERAREIYPYDNRRVATFELGEQNGRPKLFATCFMPESEIPESVKAELATMPPLLATPDSLLPAERPAARIIELDLAPKSGAPSDAPGSGPQT